jgi:class III poly(R)-hydroxyalkanoic acid synthase PhaE subunit
MPDQPHDFLKDYQAFAQQSWDTWMRYLQQQPGSSSPFGGIPPAATQDDFLTRSLANLQAYGTWLQQAAGAGINPMMSNWQQPTVMQPFFATFNQPFAQTVAGIDSASAFGLEHQWQSWLQAMQRAGMTGMSSQTATFGLTREMQLDQQALAAAMGEYAQINARYQALLQNVNADGISRLQDMLAARAEPDKQIQSLKALYDLWVDAMEEAYSQMALSDEYRDVFGELVNAQMRVRQMQQQQTEQMCRELGIPTRSEVDSLGKRLQQLRREMRERQRPVAAADESLVDALQTEIADLKRELAATKAKAKDASAVRPIKSAGSTAKATRSASSKRK